MTLEEYQFAIRVSAAIVWTAVFIRLYRGRPEHASKFRRMLITGTVVAFAWLLVLRGATIIGIIPDNITSPISAAILSATFIVGLAVLTTQPDFDS